MSSVSGAYNTLKRRLSVSKTSSFGTSSPTPGSPYAARASTDQVPPETLSTAPTTPSGSPSQDRKAKEHAGLGKEDGASPGTPPGGSISGAYNTLRRRLSVSKSTTMKTSSSGGHETPGSPPAVHSQGPRGSETGQPTPSTASSSALKLKAATSIDSMPAGKTKEKENSKEKDKAKDTESILKFWKKTKKKKVTAPKNGNIPIVISVVKPDEKNRNHLLMAEADWTTDDVISRLLQKFDPQESVDDYYLVAVMEDAKTGVVEERMGSHDSPLQMYANWECGEANSAPGGNHFELRRRDQGESDIFINKLSNAPPSRMVAAAGSKKDSTTGNEQDSPDASRRSSKTSMELRREVGENGRAVIVGGTFEMLVDNLVNLGVTDAEFFRAFLLTFRHVATAEDLIKLLLRVFEERDGMQTSMSEQLRTANFVFKWVNSTWFDFAGADNMMRAIEEFTAALTIASMEPLAHKLRELVKLKLQVGDEEKPKTVDIDCNQLLNGNAHLLIPTIREISTQLGRAPSFLELSTVGLANRLTQVEHAMFSSIRPEEFTMELWARMPKFKTLYLPEYIRWFNLIGNWVTTETCMHPEQRMRCAALEKFIALAKELLLRKNFNGLYGIMGGLNHGALSRMKKTWEAMKPESMKQLKELQTVVSQDHNFGVYRKTLAEANESGAAAIPIMGLIMKDLTAINEMPKLLDNGYINFRKLSSIYGVIKTIERFQERAYTNLDVDVDVHVVHFVSYLPSAPEKALYNYSKLYEPRDDSTLLDKWSLLAEWA
eukprot:comp6680_c0_seq1/m.2468 comp6680_c0_seq1/g.2468  ORF comp6680_c0_seq1/g.2468 comp6680_c0_seq1/m.2468 type:complete len:774 (-) comp6680_c0_seq1:79-2400(-)